MSLCNSFTEPLSYRDCHISGSFSDQKKKIFLTTVFFLFPMSAQHKLDRLTKWFDDNNIKWDKDALSIKELDGSFGIFALKDMKKSDTSKHKPPKPVLTFLT